MYRLLFTFLLVLLGGCSAHVEILTSPLRIDSGWSEIPLRPTVEARLDLKDLIVEVDRGVRAELPDTREPYQVVRLTNGNRVLIYAELVTPEKAVYSLEADGHACVGGERCRLFFGGILPRNFSIEMVRIRSSIPVTINKIVWAEGVSH